LKSDVSDLLEIALCVYSDACAQCPAEVSDLRDLMTIKARVEKEGISFLTITLPDFCKDVEDALEVGIVSQSHFRSFRKRGAIPAFLQGMLGHIFNRETGVPHETIDATFVRAVRQVCRFFSKVRIPCSPQRVSRAINRFKEVEHGFSKFSLSPGEMANFRLLSDILWTNLGRSIDLTRCNPRHGPGATAERISGNRKYRWQRWHARLEPLFPLVPTAYPLAIFRDDTRFEEREEIKNVTIVPEEEEQPVRVVFVPKTLKTPRVIAIEPVCMQYAQQALRSVLYSSIERYWLTAGHINFRDQSINQQKALDASRSGLAATLDLSDASDRVPRDLALEMFWNAPVFQEALDVTRSRSARLPSGEVIHLRKFASMGSALCFPIESLYFYTLCVLALLESRKLPITPRNAFIVSREVFVYGDDLIVPAHEAESVSDCLQKYNCKVNKHKSFWTGKFRESCGLDAFAGEQVTPVYLRRTLPRNRKQVPEILSTCATANLLAKAGMMQTATLLFGKLERILGVLPYVSSTSQALGRVSLVVSAQRWDSQLHRYEVNAYVAGIAKRSDRLSGYAALQKVFIEANNPDEPLPPSYEERLEFYSLRGGVTLKRRWVPVS
jgi:hypothetical protein